MLRFALISLCCIITVGSLATGAVVADVDKSALIHDPSSSVPIPQSVDEIVDTCYQYLESHLCEGEKWGHKYHFYKPSIDKYSSDQWLWDSGAHMIVWSHKNVTNSILDLRTMLKMQQENGRIPEEIFWMDRDAKQTAAILAEYSSPKYSDTTQMPVLPFSLRAIYDKSKSKTVLKEFLYPLIDYFVSV